LTYNLEVENAAGWVMRKQLSDVMYSGGLRADTRTVHEIKNYENQLGSESDYFINFFLMVFLLGCSEVQLPAEPQPH
jgi:hypothetical protein